MGYQEQLEAARRSVQTQYQPVNVPGTAAMPSVGMPAIAPPNRTPTPYQAGMSALRESVATQYQPVNQPAYPPTPQNVPHSVAPRTPDAAAASYAQHLGAPSVAPPAADPNAVSISVPNPALVGADVASAYRQGAQTSTATGVGMAAREALVSPVSRFGGAALDAGMSVANAAYQNVGKPVIEGVRAFVTGRPPAPSVAPVTGASLAGAPVVSGGSTAPSVAARAPVTIDGATGQPVAAGPGNFTQGGLTVTQQGNQRTITGDAPAAQRVMVSRSPNGMPLTVAPPQAANPNLQRVSAKSALGGLMGSMAGISVARGQNNLAQRDFKNQLKAVDATMSVAKTGSDLRKSAAETKRLETENRNQERLGALREQLAAETDPKKRAEIERKITGIAGKAAPKQPQITVLKSTDAQGMVTETPYMLDEATGYLKPAIQPQQQAVTVDAAKAAIAQGADKNKVNERLKAAGLPTL